MESTIKKLNIPSEKKLDAILALLIEIRASQRLHYDDSSDVQFLGNHGNICYELEVLFNPDLAE